MADPRHSGARVPGKRGGTAAGKDSGQGEGPPSLDLPARRVLLDEALVQLRAVKDPKVPLGAVKRHVEAALRALYGALVSSADEARYRPYTTQALARARAGLDSLNAAGSQDAAVARSVAALSEATRGWEQAARRTLLHPLELPRPPDGARPRRLTDTPALLTLPRGPVPPAVVLPLEEQPEVEALESVSEPPMPLPAMSLDALLAQAAAAGAALEAPPRKEPAPPPAHKSERAPVTPEEIEQEQFGARLSREEVELLRAKAFFEELAMMSVMRQPDAGELWSNLRPVEERLLARVEGILACGEWVLSELVALLCERPVPDPEMTWAALFIHGSLAGEDTLHQMERLLRTAGLEEPVVFDAACDALAFVPHPGLQAMMRKWLTDKELLHRRLAVRVLGRRGLLDAAQALVLARGEEPELALEGARALPMAPGELDLRETAQLLGHKQEEMVSCAIEALWLRHSPLGLRHAQALVAEGRGAFASAALWLAAGGGPEAQPVFEAALARGASPVLLEALGWYGNLQFMEPLLALLEKGKVAAVGALQRLTGASLTDEEPEPEYVKGEEPFVRGFSPPSEELELSMDAAVWSAWWKQHRGRASVKKRYRWGHLWSAQDNLWEMELARASMPERRRAFHELVARAGAAHPFEPRDFVARQQAALARWREAPEPRRITSGTWPPSFSR
ncbi:HEAT repeat domain-containing protein [Hyalangium versicolor]|uniref:HEAT repeat domain-containing protein n=1 Tax=Hyalangium versicolor TaxID=2861190 RepID=UPI001CCE8DC8|nr:HEAT repeat domain-containing protein [Hyalangium versicolor]